MSSLQPEVSGYRRARRTTGGRSGSTDSHSRSDNATVSRPGDTTVHKFAGGQHAATRSHALRTAEPGIATAPSQWRCRFFYGKPGAAFAGLGANRAAKRCQRAAQRCQQTSHGRAETGKS